MDKVKQVVDKIVHPKDHSSTSTTHTTGDPTHAGNHTVSHAGTGAHTGTTGHSTGVTGAGPHSSSLANKADPRIDSDLDGSRNVGAAQHGPGGVHNNQHSSGLTGTNHSSGISGTNHSSGLTGNTHSSGLTGNTQHVPVTGTHGSAPTGPHSSNLANKLDPRVPDTASSGLPGSHNQHNSGLTGTNHGTTGSSGLTGGYGSTSTNAGPHNSNILNSADPRVDSDRDGSRNLGAAQYGPGAHQTPGTGSGLTGNQHSSGLTGNNHGTGSGLTGNNHGSGLTGSNHGTTGSGLTGNNHSSGLTGNNHSSGLTGTNHGTHGPVGGFVTGGPAPNTAGPHKNDTLNKLDPRVDSDRDGSKTVGQAPAPQY